LNNSARSREHIRPIDFCEFYSLYHRSPFDGIRVYIPKMFTLPKYSIHGVEIPDSSRIIVIKKKAIFGQDGSVIGEESEEVELDPGAIDIELNKDEYIYDVIVEGSLVVFLSDFMRIRVNIKVKPSFNNINNVRLRLSSSDYTYIEERYFDYVSQ
jgi:hypothetical protein